MTLRSYKDGSHEVMCANCDGCGVIPNINARPYRSMICKDCNGHGVLLVDKKLVRPVAFDVDKGVGLRVQGRIVCYRPGQSA